MTLSNDLIHELIDNIDNAICNSNDVIDLQRTCETLEKLIKSRFEYLKNGNEKLVVTNRIHYTILEHKKEGC